MAKVKPCRRCGHSKTAHTLTNGVRHQCKYRYHARDGANLHAGIDTDENGHWKTDANGYYPKQYQCLCPGWLPEEKFEIREDDLGYPHQVFIGYEDGLNRDGSPLRPGQRPRRYG